MYKPLIFILFFLLLGSCREKITLLQVIKVAPTEPGDIVDLGSDSLVKPVLYTKIPELAGLTVEENKKTFIAMVLPAILWARHTIEHDRNRIKHLQDTDKWSSSDSAFFNSLKETYKASDLEDLIMRTRTHPTSIVLAQAAVESGWGSSRFFREANNLFGIWSYRENEPRIRASFGRQGEEIYLRKYDNISASIVDYYETLGRSRHYRKFREQRNVSNDALALLPHLRHYSERKMEYVAQLRTIIRQNDFTKYDAYILDPGYYKTIELAL